MLGEGCGRKQTYEADRAGWRGMKRSSRRELQGEKFEEGEVAYTTFGFVASYISFEVSDSGERTRKVKDGVIETSRDKKGKEEQVREEKQLGEAAFS